MKIQDRTSYKKLKSALDDGHFKTFNELAHYVYFMDKHNEFGTARTANYYIESLEQLKKDLGVKK